MAEVYSIPPMAEEGYETVSEEDEKEVSSEEDNESSEEQYFDFIHDFQPETDTQAEDTASTSSRNTSYRISHESGDAKLTPHKLRDFLATDYFDGKQALEMVQKRFSIDYGHSTHGSRRASNKDECYPTFHLDMLTIIGEPMRPVARSGGFFDNINLTLRRWQAPYAVKYISQDLGFELAGRTFRLATSSTREHWFIVMHPIRQLVTELPDGEARRRRQRAGPRPGSAVSRPRAEALAGYIKQIFLEGSLLGEGIEPSWRLNQNQSRDISGDKWAQFQELFMQRWDGFLLQHPYDNFWQENHPAFHAYDYGANRKIETTEAITSLPRESTNIVDGVEGEPSDDNNDDEEDDSDGGVTPDERRQARPRYIPESPRSDAEPWDEPWDEEALFNAELRTLREALEQKYDLGNVSMVSYALAANINCVSGRPVPSSSSHPGHAGDGGLGTSLCMLADFSSLPSQYNNARLYEEYPLAFHPQFGNFTSRCPPLFLRDICTIMRSNMQDRNNLQDVISFGFFQGYSNIKRYIRSRSEDLLATKGIATAALTLPTSEAKQDRRALAKQQRLLHSLRGGQTPEQPSFSIPFARERHRLESAIAEEEFAYRMEQVVTIHTSRLLPSERNYTTVLRPIFQLMRLFIHEKSSYLPFLRVFRPDVFPGILCTYTRLFELALGEMAQRIQASSDTGLALPLAEGTAALDRLGSYCFTGDKRVLPSSVLRPLGTIDSLRSCAWPFLDPDILNFSRPSFSIDPHRWPCGSDRHPLLLHVASIAYHYNKVLAANRQSQVWFGQWRGRGIQTLEAAIHFLRQLFTEIWVPEMSLFLFAQLRKSVGQGRLGVPRSTEQVELSHAAEHDLQAWRDGEPPFENPFCTRSFTLLFPHRQVDGSPADALTLPPPTITTKTRDDLAQELYDTCVSQSNRVGATASSSTHATWFPMLRNAIKLTPTETLSARQWVDAISAAVYHSGIEWLPGTHRQRLSSRRAVRLTGYSPSTQMVLARPGSMKREALEADLRLRLAEDGPKRVRRRFIDFGQVVPFAHVPDTVTDGFQQLFRLHEGKKLLLGHYHLAHITLIGSLGSRHCDLLLMLALTLASSTRTPIVQLHDQHFTAATTGNKHQKEGSLFAANLVTRMLWTLRPDAFPLLADKSGVMCIKEMTKKIEHKGVSNRVLRALGWIRVKSGGRPTPRNSEVELNVDTELLDMHKDLLAARYNPEQFISLVFHSDEKAWVERCSSLIKQKTSSRATESPRP